MKNIHSQEYMYGKTAMPLSPAFRDFLFLLLNFEKLKGLTEYENEYKYFLYPTSFSKNKRWAVVRRYDEVKFILSYFGICIYTIRGGILNPVA